MSYRYVSGFVTLKDGTIVDMCLCEENSVNHTDIVGIPALLTPSGRMYPNPEYDVEYCLIKEKVSHQGAVA